MRKKWAEQEILFLKENYNKMEYREIARKLNKNRSSIEHKATRLGLYKRPRWTNIDIGFLKKNYSILELGEIANILGRKRKSIIDKAHLLKIRLNPTIEINSELKPLIDGLLLGDGCVTTSGSISINQREDRIEWLQDLQKRLLEHRIVSKIYNGCKEKEIIICGKKTKQRKAYILKTRQYPTILNLREKWYPDGKKVVPKDVDLSPISLAQWYMGDGHRFTSKKTNGLNIYCDGFQRKEVEFLRDRLNLQYRLSFHLWNVRNVLQLSRKKHAEIFLRITKPYKIDCFNYKWRGNYELDRKI